MCGILGFCGRRPIAVRKFHRGLASIRHRGPDDEGYLFMEKSGNDLFVCRGEDSDPGIDFPDISEYHDRFFSFAFGFRRLSILDLTAAGRQPMSSSDGRYWIIFNGEIYNHVELRNELEALGYDFTSTSDTEVLLTGYCHWGRHILDKLVGMFAFAILDTSQKKLFLARDFFGIKPLYYICKDDQFAFASEAKALVEMEMVGGKLDAQAVYMYLRHGLTDYDDSTLWGDVKKIPPAHYMEIQLDSLSVSGPIRYWQIDSTRQSRLSLQDASAQLRELFLQSVQFHLRSDVPVGVALSGGIDSSAIISAMQFVKGQNSTLDAFSYLAEDPVLNEEKWVNIAGKNAGASIHKTSFSSADLLNDVDRLIYHLDEPFSNTSVYAQYCVFRLAQQNRVKVMLDGQGADELLGGYSYYLSGRLISLLSQGSWLKAASFLKNAWVRPDSGRHRILLRMMGLLVPESLQKAGYRLAGIDLEPPWMNAKWFKSQGVRLMVRFNSPSTDRSLQNMLLDTLTVSSLPMLLRYEDRNSMAHSVESRVPFLTPQIAQFILSLPEEMLIDGNAVSKFVFKNSMRGLVPDLILDRQDKIGFNTPEQHLLSTLNAWGLGVFDYPIARSLPLLNLPQIKKDFLLMVQGRKGFDGSVWRSINFILWAQTFNIRP